MNSDKNMLSKADKAMKQWKSPSLTDLGGSWSWTVLYGVKCGHTGLWRMKRSESTHCFQLQPLETRSQSESFSCWDFWKHNALHAYEVQIYTYTITNPFPTLLVSIFIHIHNENVHPADCSSTLKADYSMHHKTAQICILYALKRLCC